MVTVEIYTTPTCPWCKKAKEFMKEKKIKFNEHDVSDDSKARDKMMDLSGQMGVPVLEIGGEVLVGFDPDAIMKAVESAK